MEQGIQSTNIPIYWKKNIDIIWQVTISPETNFIDPILWMKIQSSVQKVHCGRRCTHTALAKSVSDAWNKSLSEKTFKNIYGWFRVVIVCLVNRKGLNKFVKKKAGKLFRDSTSQNNEMGSDGSVAVHDITTSALQAKDV